MTPKTRNGSAPWGKIQAMYEAGEPVAKLAKDFNLSNSTIMNRASRCQWTRLPKIDPKQVAARATEIASIEVAKRVTSSKSMSRLERFVDVSIGQTEDLLRDVGDSRKVLKDKGELVNPAILRELITAHSAIVKTGREIHGLDKPTNQVNIQFNGIGGAMAQSTIEPEEIESDIIEG